MRAFRNRRFWIGLVITLVFLALFLYPLLRTGFADMGRALAEANYLYLIPALAVYFVGVFLRSVRWSYLLLPLGRFSPFRLFPLVVIGFMVNNVLPARLGIVARAIILGERERMSKMAAGGTMVVEQVFDGVTLLFFIAVVAIFGVSLAGVLQGTVYVVAGLFILALVLCLALASSERLAQWVVSLVVRLLPHRWRERVGLWLVRLVEGLGIMRSPWRLLVVFLLSNLVWLAEAGTFYFVALSFDLGQPFYVLLLATAVANLAWALLMTQGGLGSFDLAAQQTLVFFGVGVGLASSYVLVLHAVLLLPMTALGFVFLWLENLSLSRLVSRGEELSAQEDTAEGET
ncbi:MAG: lysylphosphatidylglycerol synthase transmembrane domain-containing protein [Chloroflexota bacterium]|nr:lysylphosphatidylglycerol synthase transmembrane domain-containing protein [Chloroflexota bacterium]